MKLKKFAMKGLIILFVAVFLCMFFAKTVQNITTPKIQTVQGTTGRFEQKMTYRATLHFPEITEFVISEAAKSAITVDKVYVREGHWVREGDIIFTARLTTFDDDMKKLQDEYDSKARALIDLDIPNRRLSKQSAQNDLYDAMLDSQDSLSAAMFDARNEALRSGVLLPADVINWEKSMNAAKDLSAEAKKAIQKALAAKQTFDDSRTDFFNSYENKKIKVNAETFKYINDRNQIIKAMDELSEQMNTLDKRFSSLSQVKATQSGYIVSLGVAASQAYDGIKAAYTMNKEGTEPVLRANVTDQTRVIENGTRCEIPLDNYSPERTTVLETTIAGDGTKYLIIGLPDSMKAEGSSYVRTILADGGVNVNITYRAKQATTLLPASAVRSDGDKYYVFLVEHQYAGFLSSNAMKVKKLDVTVLEKSDKYYSVSDSLDWQQIADREDRPLSDGTTVMNYVD
jgi:hypothetical protein